MLKLKVWVEYIFGSTVNIYLNGWEQTSLGGHQLVSSDMSCGMKEVQLVGGIDIFIKGYHIKHKFNYVKIKYVFGSNVLIVILGC